MKDAFAHDGLSDGMVQEFDLLIECRYQTLYLRPDQADRCRDAVHIVFSFRFLIVAWQVRIVRVPKGNLMHCKTDHVHEINRYRPYMTRRTATSKLSSSCDRTLPPIHGPGKRMTLKRTCYGHGPGNTVESLGVGVTDV